ncbi:hypothetical protein Vadar_023522 [Vaccinium darrowii]|uniref:Uncharacterized protein n=1 Tax=Vaccinium darrowii TaxID=229202 RepID=A0ACB7Y9R0_9ERIC|nr:hypothetical protein Vadar_023522 [Vaccinium darrowii]
MRQKPVAPVTQRSHIPFPQSSSGNSYPTSNLFFANVCEIKLKLDEWVECENYVVMQMVLNMIEKYNKYWENIHGFLGVAAVLDPRFKMSLIECYYTDIYGVRGVDMVENIKTRCYDLLTVYEGKNDKNHGEASSNPPPSTDNDLGRYALFLNSRKKGEAMPGNPFPTINNDDMDSDEYISDVTCVDD